MLKRSRGDLNQLYVVNFVQPKDHPVEAPRPPARWDSTETRQTVLAAAGKVGDYSHAMIQTIDEPTDESKEFQDILVQLAKQVASSTAQLVLKAKNVSSSCQDQVLQDKVIHSATQYAFATSQLVACARVVAPTIDSPACQEQLTDAARQVASAVQQVLRDGETACEGGDERSMGDLRNAAALVTQALNNLLAHIKTGPARAMETRQEQELETIITSTDRIISYNTSANDMVKHAKILAQATTHLVGQIRGEADEADSGDRDKLMGAARKLADATARMIDEAKGYAVDPNASERQIALRAAAEDVRMATSMVAEDQLRRKALYRLEAAAKNAAANAAQTISAAHSCDSSNRNPQSQETLAIHCQETADQVPRIISAVKKSQTNPEDTCTQIELVRVCTEFLEPGGYLVNSGRGAVPSVGDQSAAMHLSTCTQQLSERLAELRTSLTRVHIEGGAKMELDSAVDVVRTLDGELVEFKQAVREGRLYPVPGESTDGSTIQLANSAKMVMVRNMTSLPKTVEDELENSGGEAACTRNNSATKYSRSSDKTIAEPASDNRVTEASGTSDKPVTEASGTSSKPVTAASSKSV